MNYPVKLSEGEMDCILTAIETREGPQYRQLFNKLWKKRKRLSELNAVKREHDHAPRKQHNQRNHNR